MTKELKTLLNFIASEFELSDETSEFIWKLHLEAIEYLKAEDEFCEARDANKTGTELTPKLSLWYVMSYNEEYDYWYLDGDKFIKYFFNITEDELKDD